MPVYIFKNIDCMPFHCLLNMHCTHALTIKKMHFFLYFYFKFIYFNWRLITLQYCIGFAIHWHESAMGVLVFPILSPASHIPPHPIPLGHPSAPALINNTFKKSKWGNSGSGIQNRAGGPLWIWFQACSYITENLNLLNCIRLKDTTSCS